MTKDARHVAKTGETCEISGLYESECRHQERKLVRQGGAFPACHRGQHIVFWHLIRELR